MFQKPVIEPEAAIIPDSAAVASYFKQFNYLLKLSDGASVLTKYEYCAWLKDRPIWNLAYTRAILFAGGKPREEPAVKRKRKLRD